MKSNCPSTRCVYLIRHCESTDNTKKFERVLDLMLSIKGLQQAIKLAKITKKLKIERLISSPLRRAIQTAHIGFNGFKGPWALDPREENGVVWVTERRERFFMITRRECVEPGEEGWWYESNWMRDPLVYGDQHIDGNWMLSCWNPGNDEENFASEVCVYGVGCPEEMSREDMTRLAE